MWAYCPYAYQFQTTRLILVQIWWSIYLKNTIMKKTYKVLRNVHSEF